MTINDTALFHLASAVRKNPDQFEMGPHFQPATRKSDLAGWVLRSCGGLNNLEAGHEFNLDLVDVVRDILELTSEQADRLFRLQLWPEPFLERYISAAAAGQADQYAAIAAQRVEFFIRTGGTDQFDSLPQSWRPVYA